jgi:transposase-like protein
MAKDDELDQMLDRMIQGKTPEQVLGEGGLLKDLTKRLVERMLNGELTEHLGYPPHAAEGRGTGNSRNGTVRSRRGPSRAGKPSPLRAPSNVHGCPQMPVRS